MTGAASGRGPVPPMPTKGPSTASQGAGQGAGLVLAATALIGLAGYGITVLVPRVIGEELYSTFSVFWSVTFLISAALSGIQQEVSRAARPSGRTSERSGGHLGRFGVGSVTAVVILVLATTPLWMGSAFPERGFGLAAPLAVAGGAYVAQAVLGGVLYALHEWRGVFWLVTIDGGLRFVLIASTLLVTHDPFWLAWAVALPFPIAAAVVAITRRRGMWGAFTLDVGLRRLVVNSARTVVSAASMGLLVSGFPFLLALTSGSVNRALFGYIVLLATLTRAPLIVIGLVMQSYLVVLFQSQATTFWRTLVGLLALVAGAGSALTVLAFVLGPVVFTLVLPNIRTPSPWLLAAFVASSILVGALCVTAPALLARAHHSLQTAGWVTAALMTAVVLTAPLPFVERTLVALVAGPTAGLLVHVLALVRIRSASHRPGPAAEANDIA